MVNLLTRTFDDRSGELRGRLIGIYSVLVFANLAVWAWALLTFRDHAVLLGTALLAYSFGLRHAVDADHIAAIDNVTRKLMQEGKRPVSVGFWFAIGHSTVVVLLALAIAVTTTEIAKHFDALKGFGGVVGTSVSTLFLFLVAAMNVVILAGVWKAFRKVRARRRVRRSGLRPAVEQPWPAGAAVPAAVPADLAQLAHAAARIPVRPRFRHRDRGRPARHFRDASRRKACRSGRSWCSRRCSRRAWR